MPMLRMCWLNLALADLKRLPPGTLPPVVLEIDLFEFFRVCLVGVKGRRIDGDSAARLRAVRHFRKPDRGD